MREVEVREFLVRAIRWNILVDALSLKEETSA